MPIEQMNISLSPRMARFIRGKVKKGGYTNASEVVRDAVRRMQEAEAARMQQTSLADFENSLTQAERDGIRRGVRQGIRDIESGNYEEYDAEGLRAMAQELAGPPPETHVGAPRRAPRSKLR